MIDIIGLLNSVYLTSIREGTDTPSTVILGESRDCPKTPIKIEVNVDNKVVENMQRMADFSGRSLDEMAKDCLATGYINVANLFNLIEWEEKEESGSLIGAGRASLH